MPRRLDATPSVRTRPPSGNLDPVTPSRRRKSARQRLGRLRLRRDAAALRPSRACGHDQVANRHRTVPQGGIGRTAARRCGNGCSAARSGPSSQPHGWWLALRPVLTSCPTDVRRMAIVAPPASAGGAALVLGCGIAFLWRRCGLEPGNSGALLPGRRSRAGPRRGVPVSPSTACAADGTRQRVQPVGSRRGSAAPDHDSPIGV